MDIRFLGGAGEVGRSAILVNDRLLLDYGMKTANPPQFPVDVDPEAVVVSHGHLDHVGAIPSLLSGDARPSIHWTPPTRELALTLARDTLKLHGGTMQCPFTETDVQRVTQVSETHGYRETFEAADYVDGMGKQVTELLRQYPDFIRDADAFRRAKSHARFVTGRNGQRKRIIDQKAAIITTSGMLGNENALTAAP